MKEINGKWLLQKLAQNGFGPQDLADQTGIQLQSIEQIINTNTGSEEEWDVILDTLNDYPRIIIPSAQVLDDLQEDIEKFGEDALCVVYYGVNQNLLGFCEYQCLADLYAHGSNVPTDYLSRIQMTLAEARDLFTKQNYANQTYSDNGQ